MSNKMQQLLDLIVNEEMDKANELFHEIVVEKSRDIYENLIAEEDGEEEPEDKDVEEGFGDPDMEEEDPEEHDPAGALVTGTEDEPGEEHDEFGGDEQGDSPATKDDIQDLEDALAELKAEFEALMGDEGHDDEEDDEEDDDSDDEENPFGKKDDDSEDDEEDDSDDESEDENEYEEMGLREYRETVGNDWNTGKQKEQGRNIGSNSGETYPAPSEGKPIIRAETSKGKPTTGATAENIAQGGTGVGEMSGTSPNADKGSRGLVGSTKGEFTKGVEKNISSSSKASMTAGSKLEKNTAGHGAERKGGAAGPVGSGNGKLAGQTSNGAVKSPLTGAPNRNA